MKLKLVVMNLELTRRQKVGLAAGLAGCLAMIAAVASADVPNTFVAGETLRAVDLNQNFADVYERLDALDANVAAADTPAGAVMAFDLAACPVGWADYDQAAGRTIIGVNPDGINGLDERALGDTPGEESHAMTVSEMPSHDHTIFIHQVATGANQGLWTHDWSPEVAGAGAATQPLLGGGFQNFMTALPAGSGQSFNVMQPSLALLYCKKQ